MPLVFSYYTESSKWNPVGPDTYSSVRARDGKPLLRGIGGGSREVKVTPCWRFLFCSCLALLAQKLLVATDTNALQGSSRQDPGKSWEAAAAFYRLSQRTYKSKILPCRAPQQTRNKCTETAAVDGRRHRYARRGGVYWSPFPACISAKNLRRATKLCPKLAGFRTLSAIQPGRRRTTFGPILKRVEW